MCTAFTKSDGEVVVSVTTKGLLSLWSFENGQFLGQCDALAAHGRTPHVCAAATLGSQSHVAVAGGSADVYLVDLETKEVTACLCGKAGWVTGLHSSAVRLCGDGETPFAPVPSVLVTLCADEGKAALWHIGEDGLPIEYPADDARGAGAACVPPSRVAAETSLLGGTTTLVVQKPSGGAAEARSVSPATPPPSRSVSPASERGVGAGAGAGVGGNDEDEDDVEEREREFSTTPPVIGACDAADLLTASCAPLSVVDLGREGEGTRVVAAVLSPESLALLLVVRAEAWELYSAQSGERLLACAHPDPAGRRCEFCGGGFGDENTVAVWCGDGVCRVYGYTQVGAQLHCKLCCTLRDMGGALARFPCTEHYTDHHYVVCRCTPAGAGALDLRLSVFRIPSILVFPVTRGQGEDGAAGTPFTLSSSSKELYALYVDQPRAREDIVRLAGEEGGAADTPPSGTDAEEGGADARAAEGQRLRARELTVRPFAAGHLSSGWGGAARGDAAGSAVTASCVVEELMVLVCGHADGTLTWGVLPSLARQQTVCAHDGAVTCLRAYVDPHADLPAVLLSGGVDTTVRVWRLMTFECLHVFRCHTGVVTSITRLPVPLLSPFLQERVAPPPCATADVSPFEKGFPAPRRPSRHDPYGTLRCSCVSVGTDNCAAVLSLDTLECQCWLSGHASPIDEVRWTHDDVLYVRCKGGETYFWDLYTNALLERGTAAARVRPCVADSILVYKSKALDTDGAPAGEGGLRTCAVPVAETRGSVQVLSLDTRALCRLLSTQRAPLSSRRSFSASAAAVVPRQRPSRTSRFADTRVVVVPNPAVTAASYLLPWGLDEGVDAALRKDGFFECVRHTDAATSGRGSQQAKSAEAEGAGGTGGAPQSLSLSYGLVGVDGKRLTLFVPRAADSALARFTRDKQTSALHALAMVAIADSLTHSEGTLPSLGALRRFCCTRLFADARTVKPSLELLTALWNDGTEELAATARELSYLSAARLSAEDVRGYVGRWAPRLLDPKHRYQATLILGAVGAERGETLGVADMELIAGSVYEYYVTTASAYIRQSMTELIRRGIRNFKRYFDLSKLVESMFAAVAAGGPSTTLMAVAVEEPQLFVAALGSKVAAHEDLPACAALLGSIQGTYRAPFSPLLVSIAELSLKLIGALGSGSSSGDGAAHNEQLLHTTLLGLPELYPMAAVDRALGCCYVGGERGAVHCFDVRRGAKVAIFKGAEHQIGAVALSRDRRRLAVLCGAERTLTVWDTGAVAARLGAAQRGHGFLRSLLAPRRVLELQQFAVFTEPLRTVALDGITGVPLRDGTDAAAEHGDTQARETLPELHWTSDANDRIAISTKQGARVELSI